ncbi:MAG: RDD family protein [Pseudomonadota bacterium]
MNLDTVKDFQAFLGELLEDEKEKKLEGVRPITHGLGLESPQSATVTPQPVPAPSKPKVDVHTPRRVATPTPPPVPRKEVAPVFAPEPVTSEIKSPPPLPSASLIKRAASLFLDQVFVQTLWMIALVITSNIFSGFETGLSSDVFKSFSEPLFFRFAVLEFATLWLAYLAISLGIFNMTFGMWGGGIRISYGNQKDENYGLRKLMRILWSFLFYAPLVPSLLLVFRKNDRNLVDTLSGSNLYLS